MLFFNKTGKIQINARHVVAFGWFEEPLPNGDTFFITMVNKGQYTYSSEDGYVLEEFLEDCLDTE